MMDRSVYLFLVSLFFSPDISFLGRVLPNVVPALIVFAYILVFRVNIFYRAPMGVVASLFILCLLSVFLGGELFDDFDERLIGAIQLFYCFVFFIFLCELLIRDFEEVYSNVINVSFYVMIIFITLEVYTPLKSVFNEVRYALYSKSIYESEIRDILQYGGVRPNFLFREPAHLGLIYAAMGFHFLIVKRLGWLPLIGVMLLGMYLIRSPMVAFILPAYALFKMSKKGLLNGVLYGGLYSILSVILISVLLATGVFEGRLNNILDGLDFSAASRFIGPPLIAFEVLGDYFLWGVGLSGDSLLYGYNYDVFSRLGFDYQLRIYSNELISKRVTNYFFLALISLGCIGWVVFNWCLYRYLISIFEKKDVVVLIILFWGMGFFIGGLVTPFVWCIYFTLVVGVRFDIERSRSSSA